MAGLTKLITGLAVGIIVGAGGAIVLASKTQDAPTTTPMAAPPSYEMPHMKRPNLVVSDLNRSLEIYRDVLGFTAAKISVNGITAPLYKPAARRIKMLEASKKVAVGRRAAAHPR